MNHLNCFVLEAFAKALNNAIAGQRLADCFSNHSASCVLVFNDSALEVVFQNQVPYFVYADETPSKSRLFKPQFKALIGETILAVKPHAFERRFELQFSNDYVLLVKAYGKQSNLILYHNNAPVQSFKLTAKQDLQIPLTQYPSEQIIEWPSNAEAYTQKAWSFLPNQLLDALANTADKTAVITQWQNLKGFDAHHDLRPRFEGSNTVLSDINTFSRQQLSSLGFDQLKNNLLQSTQKQLSEKLNYLAQHETAYLQLSQHRNEEEIGHIILANMSQLPEPNKRISLFDIYLNQAVEIDWQPKLSAVDNADWYFQKAKAKPHKMALLDKKIKDCQIQITEIQERLKAIQNADNSKALKRLEKPIVTSQTQVEKPYRQFDFEGYTILVGKHAESNDQLLNQYSDKDDLWLHAKDVSGSHVIIKTKHQATPKPVIETAASLAAYFSKNRQQQLVTVMCTPRKYVRKIKGSKGLVHVSQEQTLLVSPKMP
jgi:predicted ribosome quality control (RQC) complex YloA/Tae2 family protein